MGQKNYFPGLFYVPLGVSTVHGARGMPIILTQASTSILPDISMCRAWQNQLQ
jgi:hypothetical protein